MNTLGIDPGSNSVGLCYWCTGSAIRFDRVNKSSSEKLSPVQRDMDFIERISTAMRSVISGANYLHHVVLEEPKDAQTHWSAGKGGAMAVGSLFAMGKGYGLCLAALADLPHTLGQITTYQVKSNKHGEGWQPRFKVERRPKGSPRPKGQPHKELLLAQLRERIIQHWITIGAMSTQLSQATAHSLSEHELMAFGVLDYHMRRVDRA